MTARHAGLTLALVLGVAALPAASQATAPPDTRKAPPAPGSAPAPPAAARASPEAMERWNDVPERARTQPDAVLVWGQGLFHVDFETRAVTTWLDAGHVIEKVCWMPDPGNNTDTVFVVEHGQVARLYADNGQPVLLSDLEAGDPRAVRTRHVIDLVANFTDLSAIELDRGLDGSGSGQPFWAADQAPMAWSYAASDPRDFATSSMDLQGPGTPLDMTPDRLCFNAPLRARGEGAEVFVALSPGNGLGPRLWNGKGEAPRPQPQSTDDTWFVLGFEMASAAPRCYALMELPARATRLLACEFAEGIASGTWTTLDTKLPVADPQITSLYLCTRDGTAVLVGNGYRLDVLDGGSGRRRATLALQGVVRASNLVVDACLVDLPHDDARHSFTPQAPSDLCLRDERWICGLLRVVDAHGRWSGAMQVAVWELATGALQRLIDIPAGVTQVTTLPADTTFDGWPLRGTDATRPDATETLPPDPPAPPGPR